MGGAESRLARQARARGGADDVAARSHATRKKRRL